VLYSLRRGLLDLVKRHEQRVPAAVKDHLYRRRIRLDLTPPSNLVIKVARTKAEHLAAYRLLHDAYVDAGYMAADSSGMRRSSYQLIPGYRVLIAVHRGDIVATCSFIPDGPLGLPMDAAFDLKACRKANDGIAEISALAIKRGYRGHPGRLLFPMVKYFYEYASDQLDLSGLVFCVQPRHFDFYRAFFHAQPLRNGYLSEYGFVGGAPAQAGILNFEASLSWGKKWYEGCEPERNVYDYIVNRTLPHLDSPRRDDGKSPVLEPELMRELLSGSLH